MRVMASGRAAKAYVAGAIAACAFAGPALDKGLTAAEGVGIVGAALVAFQAVFWTTNKPSTEP